LWGEGSCDNKKTKEHKKQKVTLFKAPNQTGGPRGGGAKKPTTPKKKKKKCLKTKDLNHRIAKVVWLEGGKKI